MWRLDPLLRENDIELPALTPNLMLLGHQNSLINEEAHGLENKDF